LRLRITSPFGELAPSKAIRRGLRGRILFSPLTILKVLKVLQNNERNIYINIK